MIDVSFPRIGHYLTEARRNPNAVMVFIKMMQGYLLVKVLYLWMLVPGAQGWVDRAVMASLNVRVLLLPINLAAINLNLFFGFSVLAIAACIVVRPNYILNTLFALIAGSFFFLRVQSINGSDYIQTSFSIWCIGLSYVYIGRSAQIRWVENGVFNTVVVLLRFQVAFMYLINGLDKLLDETWRSGEAFSYIAHVDTMTNPAATWLFSHPTGNAILAWATILFEIGFFVLIWFRHTRSFVLCAGIVFHLFIWWALTLPDFSAIMMICYGIFLRDVNFENVRNRVKRWLP
jgi:hypothetical protein